MDAALDTANVERIAEYLAAQRGAQYLLVTHRPQVGSCCGLNPDPDACCSHVHVLIRVFKHMQKLTYVGAMRSTRSHERILPQMYEKASLVGVFPSLRGSKAVVLNCAATAAQHQVPAAAALMGTVAQM